MTIQNQLNDLERSIGRVEGKIEEGFNGIYQRLDTINGRVNEHDKSIDGLKQETARNKGIAAGISFVVSVAIAVFSLFKHK
jgi:hypothetical protein